MRFALQRAGTSELAGRVDNTGLIFDYSGPEIYDSLRSAMSAANRRNKHIDGRTAVAWYALVVVQESTPTPVWNVVGEAECCQ